MCRMEKALNIHKQQGNIQIDEKNVWIFGKEYSEMEIMLMIYQMCSHINKNNGNTEAFSFRYLVLVASCKKHTSPSICC